MSRPPNSNRPNSPRPFGVDYVPKKRRHKSEGRGVFVGKVSDIPPGQSKQVCLEQVTVAVFNVDGRFFAIKDACPHADYPLYRGKLDGDVVICASHNWQFNVQTGQCLRGNTDIQIRTFPIEIRGDEIWLLPT